MRKSKKNIKIKSCTESCLKTIASDSPHLKNLPYGRQSVDAHDIQAVVDVLRGDWLTCGPKVTQFEEIVKSYVGARHAIAVSNGTAALHLSCLALGVEEGHIGITSPLTFLASANCIAYCGGKPDFVDIDPSRNCLDPEKLEEYIKENGVPKVVIPVDFAGVPADLPRIYELAKKHGFSVIEDAAHSIGGSYCFEGEEFKCGCCVHSDLAIFSFHPVKTVTAGEGGMVLTNDDELARRVRSFASHGMERDVSRFESWNIDNKTGALLDEQDNMNSTEYEKAPWLYQQQTLGYNYRITDIQCALGISQFQRLDDIVERRRAIFDLYQSAFSGNLNLICPTIPEETKPGLHLYVLRFKGNSHFIRIQACKALREAGIFAQVHYIPVYLQPWYYKQFGYKRGKCPKAEMIYENCLSIPLYPSMNDEDVERVIDIVTRFTNS
ncbi:MAG: UDP-4-amino-4,6-dideoxy-N-acetyl-beta-L-altrosamine transaminase [Kiritimatiellae bacterium]|jgi:perosamine synthetase|nr:UDP-4-amino-4,6-dideoxy-N-acetyl-beta-L-altrosamine transaminase [Kiritimatiellia bacterium]